MSSFLVCLLLGMGFNAFVASGYAAMTETLNIRKMTPCPFLPPPHLPTPPPTPPPVSKFRPTSPPDLNSKFYQAIEDAEQKKIQDEIDRVEEDRANMILELEKPKQDSLFGLRLHGWVLVLPGGSGERAAEITEPMFIEPTSGESVLPSQPETADLYLGIESVWNNRNYWVNMQECSAACSKLDWNLADIRKWEHLLAGEPASMRDVEDDENVETTIRREFHFVMPPSYVSAIQLPPEIYEQRYLNSKKTMFYKKSKVELYSPFSRVDGMIECVTVYEDYEYTKPIYAYEKYQERGDKLTRSEKDLNKEIVTDYYSEGRLDACKSHQYFVNNNNTFDEERTLEFYNEKRFDELSRFKMHLLYASQDYENREDLLYNRFIEYSAFNDENKNEDVHYRTIIKIVEKFLRNKDLPADKSMASREFNFVDNKIRLAYHYNKGRYSQATRSFIKPDITERGDQLVYLPHMTKSYNPNPMIEPDNFEDVIDLLEKELKAEEIAVLLTRRGETEIFNFLEGRDKEFATPVLVISPHDPIRNQEVKKLIFVMEEQKKIQSQKDMEKEFNLLTPYLARLGDLKYLTNKQALQVRNECIEDFKQTAINRANFMKSSFDKCNKELTELQAILTESENLSKEEKDKLTERNEIAMLKLRSMEVRLNRHRELVPVRYRKLLDIIQNDIRLSILYDE